MKFSCQSISKQFGSHIVLSDITFQAREGEIVCIQGENGAGKTTLLKILAHQLSPDSGEVFLEGISNCRAPASISLCNDTGFGWETLTIEEHLSFFSTLFKTSEKLDLLIEGFNLSSLRKVPFGHLSAGYRKRLALAVALAKKASIFLMDEPFSHLDQKAGSFLCEQLMQAAREAVVVFTTQVPGPFSFSTTCYQLQGGKLKRA